MLEGFRFPKNEEVVRSSNLPQANEIGGIVYDTRVNLEAGKIVCARNPHLEYVHYVTGTGSHPSFEMYLSTEAHKLMDTLGWGKIRKMFKGELTRIDAAPFGETYLTLRGQWCRIYLRLEGAHLSYKVESLGYSPYANKYFLIKTK